MKHFILFLLLTNINSTFGQHALLLKSGERMNGKVERFKNDTLTFSFKGNKMLFKSSDILALYFDDKKVAIEQPSSSAKSVEQKQEGKISGVVTYYFNENYGDKPDVGTEVLIIDVAHVPNLHSATIDSFLYVKTYKSLYNLYDKGGGKIPEDVIRIIKAYGVETKEGFDNLDNRAGEELFKMRFDKAFYTIKLITDGNGGFSSNVPVGNYYVYIRSNHRDGKNMTEVLGRVVFKKVEVRAGETATVNAKFNPY